MEPWKDFKVRVMAPDKLGGRILTPEEVKKILDQAYEIGYEDGSSAGYLEACEENDIF